MTLTFDLWPWKSIGFQILVRTKYVPRLVKIHSRMLILECSQGCYRRKDGSVTISLRNFVGEGIINYCHSFFLRSLLAWAQPEVKIQRPTPVFALILLYSTSIIYHGWAKFIYLHYCQFWNFLCTSKMFKQLPFHVKNMKISS